jgi:hypothetical protein
VARTAQDDLLKVQDQITAILGLLRSGNPQEAVCASLAYVAPQYQSYKGAVQKVRGAACRACPAAARQLRWPCACAPARC